MSKLLRRGLALLVAVALGGGAVAWGLVQKSKRETEGKARARPVALEFAPADVVAVEPATVRRQLAISGSLAPVSQAVVKARVAGEVRAIAVREGEAAAAGQVVARMDTADLEARLAEKVGNLEASRAQLALAEKNRAMNEKLLAQNFISRNAFDASESSFLASRGTVDAWEAQVRLARNQLADATLRAPIGGQVARRHVQPGEKVNVDAPVLTLVDLSRLEMQALVPAADVPRLAPGMPVSLRVDGFPGRTFPGRIERLNPTTEPGTRSIMIYVSVANEGQLLRGGMFAQGEIRLAEATNAATLPVTAIRDDDGRPYVWVVGDGRVSRRDVRLGERDLAADRVEIRSGLAAGEAVVATRLDGLRDGMEAVLRRAPDVTPQQRVHAAPGS